MPSRYEYPATVAECIDPNLRYRRATIRAVRAFARSKPWRGTFEERARKFWALHEQLCREYRLPVGLSLFESDQDGARTYDRERDMSLPVATPILFPYDCYVPSLQRIFLMRLSVVTYLHEFAHALGKGERGACRWSINLFAHCFPRSFARCQHVGHTLRQVN